MSRTAGLTRSSVATVLWLVSVVTSYRIGAESGPGFPTGSLALVDAAPPPTPAVSDGSTPSAPPAPLREAAGSAMTPAEFVARGVLAKHIDEDNPLNRNQRAYVFGGPETLAPGQVGLRAEGDNRVVFSQYPRAGAPLRTFSIAVDGG